MYAVLHVSDFSLQAVLRNEQGMGARQVALLRTERRQAIVIAATPAARAAGIEDGLTSAQALARCASLLFRSPQPGAEAEARAALLAVGLTLSPTIEDTAPGICTADLQGLPSENIPRVARAALQQLDALGLPATVGVGATPLLALYAARAAGERDTAPNDDVTTLTPMNASSRVAEAGGRAEDDALYKSKSYSDAPDNSASYNAASDNAKPDGAASYSEPATDGRIYIIRESTEFLHRLPLEAANPTGELPAILGSWGLRTLGDLTALPREDVVRRLGAEGLALWHRAAGGFPRPLHAFTSTPIFSAAMEFEEALETLEPLLFILRRFIDRLALELGAAGFVADELTLTLQFADEAEQVRAFRLPEPTGDAEIIYRALHTYLESLRTAEAITGLGLRMTPVRPLVRQTGLFETGLRDPHGFADTLARIAVLVGADRVGTPQLADTHRPDAATLVAPPPVVPPVGPPATWPAIGLPLRRFRPPLPAKLELTSGVPTYIWTSRFEGAVAGIRGPWCGSGEWWESGRAWQHTEWDIALAQGGLYRLRHAQQAYVIEGEYD